MLKSLRRKFILISMLSVGFVLAVIITGINIANYAEVNRFADVRIDIIESNGGVFSKNDIPDPMQPIQPIQPDHPLKPQKKPDNSRVSLEAAFDTRYFTVLFDGAGRVLTVNTRKISSVDEKTAADIACGLYEKQRIVGFFENFKYRAVTYDSQTMYIFLDCERELSTYYSVLLSSILISLGGMLIVYILVFFFSRLALKPVAEAYEKQKQFITDAGHEIKTPITIISANTEVIESINGESEWTKSIKRQSGRLRDLTDKLVFLSRTEEMGVSMNTYEFSLSDMLKEECASFEPLAAIEEKTLTVNIEEGLRYVGDEASLSNMISILLDNALKYSNEGGKIELTLRGVGRSREITVRNTVDSIEVGRLDFLFERFYRGDKSRNSGKRGHGIGLAIAKAIVNAHKGRISARSVDGKSVIFTVVL